MNAENRRERIVRWADPRIGLAAAATMTGLAYMRAIIAGELPPPPFASLMNMAIAEVEEGRVVFTGVPGEEHFNPVGSVHGGFAMTLLDSAMGIAVVSTLPPGKLFTTLSFTANFVRPLGLDSGTVRCTGKIVHRGSRTATAEAELRDARDRLCAHAVCSCMILDHPGPG